MCFLDQYLDQESGQCVQCKLGAYGLHPQSTQCLSCAYLNSQSLSSEEYSELEYLCANKIGQISSPDKGIFDESRYPTQEDFDIEWGHITRGDPSLDGQWIISEETSIVTSDLRDKETN